MKTIFGRVLILTAFLLGWQSCAWAQLATLTRNAPLHRDASSSSPTLEHLSAGTRLVLVNDAAAGGYFHVRTEDELVGWVWSKYVTVTTFVPQMPKEGPAPQATSCNADLWKHVYHPHRLIVKQDCISVTGKIVDATKGKKPDGVRHEGDGDTHGWLKLDPEFENLLNSGNLSDEEGNLVFEIVCKFPVKQADAKTACKGYQADIAIPPVGSHVRIVGTYVQDTFHAQWMEIHPVTSITVVP